MDDALTAHATGRTGSIRDSHPLRQFSLRYRPLPHALPREFDSLELRLETFFFFFFFFFFFRQLQLSIFGFYYWAKISISFFFLCKQIKF